MENAQDVENSASLSKKRFYEYQTMNPTQRGIQLNIITQIIEGSGIFVNIPLPGQAQKTKGRPKGTSNKPKSTTTRDPYHFNHIRNRRRSQKNPSKFNQSEKS
ncbi:hypothetical protein VP01_1137g5 [Puccinia sorghi]|uniref:Uncharacterized protein n=1 Tax=Puccinia sorghi TaxID=27349 RepID=A0A0L6VRZ6_9BASI|nr:hypothetical protein VP01_1137g5 [Puccinia sorghi]